MEILTNFAGNIFNISAPDRIFRNNRLDLFKESQILFKF